MRGLCRVAARGLQETIKLNIKDHFHRWGRCSLPVHIDEQFQELSARNRKRILDRLLSEIRGRMMEEIILLETRLANPDKKVFKLQFPIGEFDMVVCDTKELTCRIYEVKYSKEQVSEQYRHLNDDEKCSMTSHRYGDIVGKYVIYRGEPTECGGIRYLNVEDYLKSLK